MSTKIVTSQRKQAPCKPARAKIPKVTKDIKVNVWKAQFDDKYNGICYVCNKELTLSSFACSRIISEANGGDTLIGNLKITCNSCNLSCGALNLDDFKIRFFKTKFDELNKFITAEQFFLNKTVREKMDLIDHFSYVPVILIDGTEEVSHQKLYKKISTDRRLWDKWYSMYEQIYDKDIYRKIIQCNENHHTKDIELSFDFIDDPHMPDGTAHIELNIINQYNGCIDEIIYS